MALTKADIQFIRTLAGRRERAASGLFIAEGAKLVGDLCGSPLGVRRIYATADPTPEMAGTETVAVSAKEMERISQLKTPTPYLALVGIPRHTLRAADLAGRLTLALDDVQDPGNLGTIIRVADWFGIGDIVCTPRTADCFNPKVVQATMGAIARVCVHYTDLAAFLAETAAEGLPCFGTFLEGDNIYRSDLATAGIVVMGNEGNGISDGVARAVTHKLFIPPYPAGEPTSESLNVATATAIICSEFRRRA
ncbi:MAG: RNA methyltransferase [Rikenellaceae bacterium]|nr:RNA methyltransferase [Rikenellaceae bacterium]